MERVIVFNKNVNLKEYYPTGSELIGYADALQNFTYEKNLYQFFNKISEQGTISGFIFDIEDQAIGCDEKLFKFILQFSLLVRLSFEKANTYNASLVFIVTEKTAVCLENHNSLLLLSLADGSLYLKWGTKSDENIRNEIHAQLLIGFSAETKLSSLINEKLIDVSRPSSNSHQLANEWGALKIAVSIRDKSLQNELLSNLSLLSSPYFKFIIAKNKLIDPAAYQFVPQVSINSNPNSPIVLIDDNADSGWDRILSKLSKECNSDPDICIIGEIWDNESDVDIFAEQIIQKINPQFHRVVFLDLRLLKSENSEASNMTHAIDLSGGKVLIKMKERWPWIQVIILTASNKAWNHKLLIEYGADGYFIKEDPEVFFPLEVTKTQFKDLINQVKRCLADAELFKWFWDRMQELIFSIEAGSIIDRNIRERVIDKLKMAFGIIITRKRLYEGQFKFRKWELVFLTLWSILNEFEIDKYKSFDYTTNTLISSNGKYKLIVNGYCQFTDEDGVSFRDDFSIRWPGKKFSHIKNEAENTRRYISDNIDSRIKIGAYLLMNGLQRYQELHCALRRVRNRLDFTHSDRNVILQKELHKDSMTEFLVTDCVFLVKFLHLLFLGKEQPLDAPTKYNSYMS